MKTVSLFEHNTIQWSATYKPAERACLWELELEKGLRPVMVKHKQDIRGASPGSHRLLLIVSWSVHPTPFLPLFGTPARFPIVCSESKGVPRGLFRGQILSLFWLELQIWFWKFKIVKAVALDRKTLWSCWKFQRPNQCRQPTNVGMPNFSSNLTGWGVGGLFNILACHNTNTNAQAAQYQYRWLASTMAGSTQVLLPRNSAIIVVVEL